jgi:predicted ATPase
MTLANGGEFFDNPNLYIVSGSPGAGKTTLLIELQKLGYAHAPEAARQIIQEQVSAGGDAVPWGDRGAYTQMMLQRSIDLYLQYTPAAHITFSDRGIPDTLCYARLIGLTDSAPVESACRQYHYAPIVFLAPAWREIYETNSERKQDFDEAIRTFALMSDVYRELGYGTIEIPKLAPAERARFVLEQLGRECGLDPFPPSAKLKIPPQCPGPA